MIPHARSSVVVIAALLSILTGWGCSAERSEDQNAQALPDSGNDKSMHKEMGVASWYGAGLAGQQTANGENFDQNGMTAAHPTLPMGSKAEVTNLDNGKKVEVTINDRGPKVKSRAIDLAGGAAKKLDMKKHGLAHVKIETKRVKKKAHIRKGATLAASSVR